MARKDKEISLAQFIKEGIEKIGIDAFKHQFGVTEGCIYHWRRGHALPTHKKMALVVKLSKGRVTYHGMIETFLKKNSKHNIENKLPKKA